MTTIQDIEARREAIVREMCSIRSMRRGTVNEQYLRVKQGAGKDPVERGPYYVLSRYEGKKTVSERLSTSEELERARTDVAEHKRFVELCKEFESLTERLGMMERRQQLPKEEKKRRSSQSKKTRRSGGF